MSPLNKYAPHVLSNEPCRFIFSTFWEHPVFGGYANTPESVLL